MPGEALLPEIRPDYNINDDVDDIPVAINLMALMR